MPKVRVRNVRFAVLAMMALSPLLLVGCSPFSMGIFTPIPVAPWVTERMEEKYCHENDFRTAILPPIPKGGPLPLCEDPPSDGMILRALDRVKRGVPYVCEEFRDNITIIPELIKDKIDPPRFFPLVGMAQLHHCHWKCTVYYTETIQSSYPFPFKCVKPRVKVVYIDKDHLHLYTGATPEVDAQITRDLIGR